MKQTLSDLIHQGDAYLYFVTKYKDCDKDDLSEKEVELAFNTIMNSNEEFKALLVYGVENLKENLTEEQFDIALNVLKNKKASDFQSPVDIFKEFNEYITEEQQEEIFQYALKTWYAIRNMLYGCYYLLTRKQRKMLIENMINFIKSDGIMEPFYYFREEFLSFSDEEREIISDCFFEVSKEYFFSAITNDKINRCMTIKLKEQIFNTLTIEQMKRILNIDTQYSCVKNGITKYKIVTVKD